jgi:hypothetical protein
MRPAVRLWRFGLGAKIGQTAKHVRRLLSQNAVIHVSTKRLMSAAEDVTNAGGTKQ